MALADGEVAFLSQLAEFLFTLNALRIEGCAKRDHLATESVELVPMGLSLTRGEHLDLFPKTGVECDRLIEFKLPLLIPLLKGTEFVLKLTCVSRSLLKVFLEPEGLTRSYPKFFLEFKGVSRTLLKLFFPLQCVGRTSLEFFLEPDGLGRSFAKRLGFDPKTVKFRLALLAGGKFLLSQPDVLECLTQLRLKVLSAQME